MAEALMILQCVALGALVLAALSATRWFWKATPCYRKHGLADKRPKRGEEEDEASVYTVVRPGAHKKPEKQKAWLKP